MGSNSSSNRYNYLGKDKKEMMENDDIGRKNIRTNYYTGFMVLTIFLILAAAAALGCGIYLTVRNLFKIPYQE